MDSIEARSIFTPATGFIKRGGFDWTCNPYVGCSFGCSYCYAAFLPQNRRPIEEWGTGSPRKRMPQPWRKIKRGESLDRLSIFRV